MSVSSFFSNSSISCFTSLDSRTSRNSRLTSFNSRTSRNSRLTFLNSRTSRNSRFFQYMSSIIKIRSSSFRFFDNNVKNFLFINSFLFSNCSSFFNFAFFFNSSLHSTRFSTSNTRKKQELNSKKESKSKSKKKTNIFVDYEKIFNNRKNSSCFEVYEKHTSYDILFDTKNRRDEFSSKESINSKIRFDLFSFDEFSWYIELCELKSRRI